MTAGRRPIYPASIFIRRVEYERGTKRGTRAGGLGFPRQVDFSYDRNRRGDHLGAGRGNGVRGMNYELRITNKDRRPTTTRW